MASLINASPEDINYEKARNAYRNTSYVPEERAKQRQAEYMRDMEQTEAELLPLAITEQTIALLKAELTRYQAGYQQHMHAMLDAMSRTASAMIVGPANFPTARNRKRMDIADRRRDNFLAWQAIAKNSMRRRMEEAQPADAQAAKAWAEVERQVKGNLLIISRIDAKLEWYTRSAFVNSIVGKIERLAARGEVQLVEKALAVVKEYNETHTKAAISPRNGFWALVETAQAAAAAAQATAEPGQAREPRTIAKFDGAAIIDNTEADRIQIVFPGKPSQEVRKELSGAGWKWSPTNEAWQRQRTENSRYSASYICKKYYQQLAAE